MAISVLKVRDKYNASNHKEFLCDTESDVTSLPGLDECAPGSNAFVVAGGSVYMMNHDGKWVKV